MLVIRAEVYEHEVASKTLAKKETTSYVLSLPFICSETTVYAYSRPDLNIWPKNHLL